MQSPQAVSEISVSTHNSAMHPKVRFFSDQVDMREPVLDPKLKPRFTHQLMRPERRGHLLQEALAGSLLLLLHCEE